jgi:hypothetical protein
MFVGSAELNLSSLFGIPGVVQLGGGIAIYSAVGNAAKPNKNTNPVIVIGYQPGVTTGSGTGTGTDTGTGTGTGTSTAVQDPAHEDASRSLSGDEMRTILKTPEVAPAN